MCSIVIDGSERNGLDRRGERTRTRMRACWFLAHLCLIAIIVAIAGAVFEEKKDGLQSASAISVDHAESMSDEEADEHLLKAAELLQNNDMSGAVDELVQIISAKPDHVAAHSALGGVLLATQQLDLAETILYTTLRLSQWTDQASIVNLASVFYQSNETALALKTLSKGYNATKAAGLDAKLLETALGDAYERNGDFSAASDWYLAAASADENNTELWLKASTLRFPPSAHKLDVAESVLLLAASKNTDNALLLYWLGRVLLGTGRTADAIALFEQVLRVDSSHTDALLSLATAHHMQQDVGPTIHYYEIALQRLPNNITLLVNYSLFLNSIQRQSDAIKLMNRAYSLDPRHAEVQRAMREMNLRTV